MNCCFCSATETIQHLFFDCHLASFIWNAVHITFGIQPPSSFPELFGAWVDGISRKLRHQFLLGVAALCWAIWLNRNDVVFNNTGSNTFMQVIFRATHWIRSWSQLHKSEDARDRLKKGCQILETMVMEVFANFGWRFANRITL
jgi:hypothetical protein